MTSKIRVLSDHTINKIAAGEVIENPSSVVKELVENSLDAGASEICIEIKGGGRQLIRITDNGCGMSPDDALLCLERHATSKIKTVEEIHDVTTMGFRGEAIPSIASISKFTLLTRLNDGKESSSLGTMVIVDGGKIMNCSPVACSAGTTIEVKSLFFNIPVRKKFLKSPAVDANEIHKVISLLSLGYPEIKFQLVSDGKSLLSMPLVQETTFQEKLKARIGAVIGQDFMQHTKYLESTHDSFKVQGVVGQPSYTRHNRSGQYLFINQRAVISPLVSYAVKDGYGTALPTGRHPVFVLHLTMPGGYVDVNVHPQKREVRLRQEPLIRDLIIKAVTGSLQHHSVESHELSIESKPNFLDHFSIEPQQEQLQIESPVFAKAWNAREESIPSRQEWVFRPKPSQQPQTSWQERSQEEPLVNRPLPSSLLRQELIPHASLPLMNRQQTTKLPPRILGTIVRYILLEEDGFENELNSETMVSNKTGGLVFVDQRGAHARILYEKLLHQENGQPLSLQTLLIPHPIEVSPFESEALRTAMPTLQQMGIHIQEFGPRSFVIDAIPQMFGDTNLEILVADIIRDVRTGHGSKTTEEIFKRERCKQMALAAGRAAMNQERRLSLVEAQSLIEQLMTCQQPQQCPTGKSIIARLTIADLAKLFHRG